MSERTVRYSGASTDEAQRQYTADSARAQAAGWRVARVAWESAGPQPTLVTTYASIESSAAADAADSRPDSPAAAKGRKKTWLVLALILGGLAVVVAYMMLLEFSRARTWSVAAGPPTAAEVYRYSTPGSMFYVANSDERARAITVARGRGIYVEECYLEHGGGTGCADVEPPAGATILDALAVAERHAAAHSQAALLYGGVALALLTLAIVAFQSRRPLPPRTERNPRLRRPGKGWIVAMVIMFSLGIVGSIATGEGLFSYGNLAGAANGVIAGLFWVLVVFLLFAVTTAVQGVVNFARRRLTVAAH